MYSLTGYEHNKNNVPTFDRCQALRPIYNQNGNGEAKKLTTLAGQATTLFTTDLQLYRVALNVQWVYPNLFGDDCINRLGGMHFLMSFVGAIGSVMSNSGLEDIMKAAFGGVAKMLTGKKYPQNTRALRLVVEEILRDTLYLVDSYHDKLFKMAEASHTSKH